MPDYPTPTHMDPAVWATYAGAHEQAEAARYAADVAAQMAWDTAVLQVWVGGPIAFITAIAALIAGGLAYKGSMEAAKAAIKAAEYQVQLEKDKHTSRVKAYAIRQRELILTLVQYNAAYDGFCDHIVNILNRKDDTAPDFLFLINETEQFLPRVIPEDWNDEKWEDHALLGERFVIALIIVRHSYNMFQYSIAGFDVLKDNIMKNNTFNKEYAKDVVSQHKDYIRIYGKDLEALMESFHDLMEKNGLSTP